MGIKATRPRARSRKCGASGGDSVRVGRFRASSANDANAPVPAARADVAQSTSENPCRYVTAQEMGKAFGRPMKSSNRQCLPVPRTESDLVVVKVETGSEGNSCDTRGRFGAGPKNDGESVHCGRRGVFESILPAFIGGVGDHEVQIDTTSAGPRQSLWAFA